MFLKFLSNFSRKFWQNFLNFYRYAFVRVRDLLPEASKFIKNLVESIEARNVW